MINEEWEPISWRLGMPTGLINDFSEIWGYHGDLIWSNNYISIRDNITRIIKEDIRYE